MHNYIYGHQIYPENRIPQTLKDITGIKHHSSRNPIAPQPGEFITLTVTTSGPLPFDEIRCWYTADDASPFPRHPSVFPIQFHPTLTEWNQPSWDYVRTWQGQLPPQEQDVILRYRIAGRVTGSDRWVYADSQTANPDEATDFAVYIGDPAPPAWTKQAILYHIFLDRFYPGDGRPWNKTKNVCDFYGGTLCGVIDKLPYLQELGINALWLSPLFASPSHHGYDPTDLYTVEPRLGTNTDLKELVEKAHALGIRILLDFVPNHWSNEHPTFLDAQANPDSPYRDWYFWNTWPDEYESFFAVKTMPKLNLRHGSPARTHMIEAARYWLEQGIDGFRLDHANGPAQDFWADFRRTCHQANPDCWLFGEVVKPPPLQRAYYGNLHGQLDFAVALAVRETFALDNWNLAQFEAFLAAHATYFPAGFSRPAFIDNHDMNRFLMLAGNDLNRLKLAALLLYTLPDAPILYYGTETGLSQEKFISDGLGFDEARLPMVWDDAQNPDLLQYFKTLIRLRKTHPALTESCHHTLVLDPDAGLYAYTPAPDILIALNTSLEPRDLIVPMVLPSTAKDHLNAVSLTHYPDHLTLHLPPQTGTFITVNPC